MPLNLLVLVKPVVDPKSAVRFKPDGTIDRSSAKLVVNPYDKYAVEAALQLRERYGGKVLGLSMAPPNAVDALREVLAMGVDDLVLISDPRLAGSDTLATSYALSMGVRRLEKEVGRVDMILCGVETFDSNTGHIGPEIGEWLDLPSVSYVDAVLEVAEGHAKVRKLIEGGYMLLRVRLPAVLSVAGTSYQPRIPSLKDVLAARRREIRVWRVEDAGIDPSLIGLSGSPTRVVKLWRVEMRRKGKVFSGSDPDALVEQLLEELRKDGVALIR